MKEFALRSLGDRRNILFLALLTCTIVWAQEYLGAYNCNYCNVADASDAETWGFITNDVASGHSSINTGDWIYIHNPTTNQTGQVVKASGTPWITVAVIQGPPPDEEEIGDEEDY